MGDPVWLPDVLRAAGLKVRVHQPHPGCGGAFENGHGDFGDIWGMMFHHTGSYGETENGIAHHPDLGLCSQCLVLPDGTWVVCGVGIAYHAGIGSYPGVPRDDGNRVLIGVEVANNGGGAPGKPHRAPGVWSDEQYNSVVTGFAACLKHMGKNASRGIGHKEYAGAAQGKWDPGAIDMDIWRRDVQNVIDGGELEGDEMGWLEEKFSNFRKINLSYKDLLWWMDKNTSEVRDQLLGPDDGKGGFKGWKILGRSKVDPNRDNTVVEALADLQADVRKLLELHEGEGGK